MNAYVCDRCGKTFQICRCEIRVESKFDEYGGYYTKHICKKCEKALKRWLKEGVEK